MDVGRKGSEFCTHYCIQKKKKKEKKEINI